MESASPYLELEPRTEQQVRDERRAKAPEAARAALDAFWSTLRRIRDDAEGDAELVEYLKDAIDGNCDSLAQIGGLIIRRQREAEADELERQQVLEEAHEHGLRSPAMTGRI